MGERKGDQKRDRRKSQRRSDPASNWIVISGRHPVLEALNSGRKMKEIVIAEGVTGANVQSIMDAASQSKVPVKTKPRQIVEQIAGFDVHQGVVAYIRPVEYMPLDRLLPSIPKGEGLLLIATGIEDPHNLGALIRSANAAGAHGVIVTKHRAAGLNETVIKASAGAALYTPVVQVTNVRHSIQVLKDSGYWIYGASSKNESSMWDVEWSGDVAIVIGSEGKGIPQHVADNCDFRVSIPMMGAVSSLNASVAGALLLYEVQKSRMENRIPK